MTREAAILLRRLFLIFVLAVIVNYVWELAQTPFYEDVKLPGAFWHCFVAALGDGVLVLFLSAVVAAVMRSHDWYLRPGAASYVAMAVAGLAVGFAVEWWGLQIAKRWRYSDLMPVIPWLGIGAAPVLQMLLLPPAIFAVVRKLVAGPERK